MAKNYKGNEFLNKLTCLIKEQEHEVKRAIIEWEHEVERAIIVRGKYELQLQYIVSRIQNKVVY